MSAKRTCHPVLLLMPRQPASAPGHHPHRSPAAAGNTDVPPSATSSTSHFARQPRQPESADSDISAGMSVQRGYRRHSHRSPAAVWTRRVDLHRRGFPTKFSSPTAGSRWARALRAPSGGDAAGLACPVYEPRGAQGARRLSAARHALHGGGRILPSALKSAAVAVAIAAMAPAPAVRPHAQWPRRSEI